MWSHEMLTGFMTVTSETMLGVSVMVLCTSFLGFHRGFSMSILYMCFRLKLCAHDFFKLFYPLRTLDDYECTHRTEATVI